MFPGRDLNSHPAGGGGALPRRQGAQGGDQEAPGVSPGCLDGARQLPESGPDSNLPEERERKRCLRIKKERHPLRNLNYNPGSSENPLLGQFSIQKAGVPLNRDVLLSALAFSVVTAG